MKKLLSLIILFVSVTAFDCGKDKKPNPGGDGSDVIEKTALGVNIHSARGTSAEIKNMIDASLTDVFADARALNYQNKLNHSDYTVYVEDGCVLSPVDKQLSFKIVAQEYNGTIYDVNPDPNIGQVYAAEMVLQQRGGDGGMYLIPEYIMCNDTTIVGQEAARNGPEHIILFFGDMVKYNETKFHGNGGPSHPIIPHRDKTAVRALVSQNSEPKTIQTDKGIAVITK